MDKARLYASGLKRAKECPGSVRLDNTTPKDLKIPFSTEAAERGTRCHRYAELLVKETETAPEILEADAAELADAKKAVQMANSNLAGPVLSENCELSFYSGLLNSNVILDRIVEHPDNSITIIDYKFGAYDVEARLQLIAGGDAVLRDRHNRKVPIGPNVRLMVVKPRVIFGSDLEIIDTTPAQLHRWVHEEIAPIVEAANALAPVFKIGTHCHWCPVRHVCQERTKLIAEGVDVLENAEVKALDSTRLGVMLDMLDVYLEHAKNLRDTLVTIAESRLEKGERVPGWQWVYGRGGRVFKDEKIARDLCRAFGVDPDERKMKSVAKLEKELSKKTLEALVHKIPGKRQLGRAPDAFELLNKPQGENK